MALLALSPWGAIQRPERRHLMLLWAPWGTQEVHEGWWGIHAFCCSAWRSREVPPQPAFVHLCQDLKDLFLPQEVHSVFLKIL